MALLHRAKERANIFSEQLRLLHRGEVTTRRHHGPVLDIEGAIGPRARRLENLAREDRGGGRRLDALVGVGPPWVVAGFIVEAAGGVYRLSDPVDHDVGEQLILAEALFDVAAAIRPGAEFLDDPRGQSRR